MNKRIIALAAALLLVCSAFTACGDKTADESGVETSINVIENGTSAVIETDTNGDPITTNSPDFDDPGAALGEPDETEAPVVTTLPANHDDIVDMIENAEVTTKATVLTDYNVDYTTRYGYNQLNDAEKKLYGQILEAVKSVRLKVEVDESVTDEMWVKVYGCLYMQEPQVFWLSSKKVTKGKLWYWEVDPELIASMQKEIDAKVSTVLAQAEGKSDYDKIKVFHDYITLNNDFVKDEGFNQTIYGGFVTGTIQCEGYAKTMQYLCDLANIESTVIVGTNEGGDTHAWNNVKLDGKWYNIDCTWDDPILTEVDKTNVRYRYFLVPDEWIHNKSHFNVNQKITGTKVTYFTPPACTSDDLNYFKVTNQLYSDKDAADTAIRNAMKTAADNKMRVAEIRVSSKSVYDEVTANLKEYASWIKEQNSAVSSVSSNCDPNTLVIELDLIY